MVFRLAVICFLIPGCLAAYHTKRAKLQHLGDITCEADQRQQEMEFMQNVLELIPAAAGTSREAPSGVDRK